MKRFLSLILLLVLIHTSAVIQSCELFMRCGDPLRLEVDVNGVHAQAFAFADGSYDREFPLDRASLGLWLEVVFSEHIGFYPGGIVANAHAFKCQEEEIRILQSFDSVHVFRLWPDSTQDISDKFVGVMDYPTEVSSIHKYLAYEERTVATFQYTETIKEDLVQFVVAATMDNGVVFTDTIEVRFH
ncbi:MAG: hypothetical protein RJQ14_21335 [Marinoscillum sp.]